MISATPTAQPAAAARRRPVAWRRLAWVTLRQRRGALIGICAVLGVFAVYLLIMGIIQNNAYAAIQACHPAAATKCHELAESFGKYWGGGAGPVLAGGGAQTVSSLLFALPPASTGPAPPPQYFPNDSASSWHFVAAAG